MYTSDIIGRRCDQVYWSKGLKSMRKRQKTDLEKRESLGIIVDEKFCNSNNRGDFVSYRLHF
jgi:hypothetical protein